MAGETTKFIADAIFSGLNEGLRGRRALKEEQRLQALKLQEEERLRNAALRDLQDRYALQDQRYNTVLRPRALKELEEGYALQDQRYNTVLLPREQKQYDKNRSRALKEAEELYNQKQIRLDNEREKMLDVGGLIARETNNPDYNYGAMAKAYTLPEPFNSNNKTTRLGASALKEPSENKAKILQELKQLDDYIRANESYVNDLNETVPARLDKDTLAALNRRKKQLIEEYYGHFTLEDEKAVNDAENEIFKTSKSNTAILAPNKGSIKDSIPADTLKSTQSKKNTQKLLNTNIEEILKKLWGTEPTYPEA